MATATASSRRAAAVVLTMAEERRLLVSAVAEAEAAKSTAQASGSRVGRVADGADAVARLRSDRYRQVRIPRAQQSM